MLAGCLTAKSELVQAVVVKGDIAVQCLLLILGRIDRVWF
jgi:hypothetical protein